MNISHARLLLAIAVAALAIPAAAETPLGASSVPAARVADVQDHSQPAAQAAPEGEAKEHGISQKAVEIARPVRISDHELDDGHLGRRARPDRVRPSERRGR